jgi:hypothetical protein
VIALLALFVALGAGAYAAGVLPANSVGTKQLKDRSVTVAKLDQKARAWLQSVGPQGVAGAPGAQGVAGLQGPKGDAGPSTPAVIGDKSITTAELADGSVNQEKLGLTAAVSFTGVQSTATWTTAAHCPSGTSIISGSVMVVDQDLHLLNGVAAISYSGPYLVSGDTWEGAAYRTNGATPWGLNVIAFCMPT